ncbi:DNA polymerase alpha subunit B isoform X2 [Amyelois transitella]|uniref:DNA polymerase alpha subunit B isoform X2 n=1 Tax=Amyelois transitella TaxID=680683 RepID=UPI0029902E5D|nr:DNA polymerase alpha subunit B isoform X2 [Amyelois transitella]
MLKRKLQQNEFSKRAVERPNAPAKEASRSIGSSLTVYGAPVTNQSDNTVLSNYMAATPKGVKVEPDSGAASTELAPVTFSPTIEKSAKYASRGNQGTVVHSYGDEKVLEDISHTNSLTDVLNLTFSQIPNADGEVYARAMFGFELLHEKASVYDNHIQLLSQYIMEKAGITNTESTRHKTQTDVWVAGQIQCDADARLNPKSVVLQGTWEESLSQSVPVDLDELKQYSLFPGQVVLMRGINPRGDKFIAREVLCDGSTPPPDPQLWDTLEGKLSMVIAAGPYTTSDNLLYEPLKDLVLYIAEHKPHVVILTGPFLDSEHSKVKDNSIAETYKSFFEKLVDSLAELQSSTPNTHIFIVSSLKDAFHVNIFPTPPYSTRRKHPNIHFVPDPCNLKINGVIVAVTSTDVLMHISQEEISLGTTGDKQSRLAAHILWQRGHYPLLGAALSADAMLWSVHAQLNVTPHVLVLPSNFRYFIKEVEGCVIMNPEHLTKGLTGGTFARLLITGDGDSLKIGAQIVRI